MVVFGQNVYKTVRGELICDSGHSIMVTTRKTSDSKVIAMDDKTGGATVPPKTLLGDVNRQLTCALCHGYYIDATTIVECLHSFCRSCIIKHLQVKSYCPICEMMINSAKPNIKPDKALQDIVYKLVPGLFQREMQRRQAFYASRPGAGANATPEQRGEDTERIIFSPEDVISFSLEYMDTSEADNVSSKSSESGNESTPSNEIGAPTRRYLQCPAVVNISHLKKFLSMKYDVDATHFFVDILYKRVPLPEYYTLMDIAYIYNWKRNEPMRFFYQISDFTAIRDRFGFFRSDALGGRKGKGGDDSGAPSSPAPSQTTEGGSDASSGSFSPLSHEKGQMDFTQDQERRNDHSNMIDGSSQDSSNMESQASPKSSSSVDVEKSQFLNSFELTAKSSVPTTPSKVSPSKDSQSHQDEKPASDGTAQLAHSPKKPTGSTAASQTTQVKVENQTSPSSKRKNSTNNDEASEPKKTKGTPEKAVKDVKPTEVSGKELRSNDHPLSPRFSSAQPTIPTLKLNVSNLNKSQSKPTSSPSNASESSQPRTSDKNKPIPKPQIPSVPIVKMETDKKVASANKSTTLKRKADDSPSESLPAKFPVNVKPEVSKGATQPQPSKTTDAKNGAAIKNTSTPIVPTSKSLPLLPKANVIPRTPNRPDVSSQPSEIKKEVPKAAPLSTPRPMQRLPPPKVTKPQGDPLKSLFDSCNINIPSSLSITLTDQKEEGDSPNESSDTLKKVNSACTTTSSTSTSTNTQSQKSNVPSQVRNSIEILKIPEESNSNKANEEKVNKSSSTTKTSEGLGNAKGPVPNLKPIADVKIPITKPQTFQQTFLQSLQQQSEKPKYIKTKMDFPKVSTPSKVDEQPSSESTNSSTAKPATPAASAPTPKYNKPVPMAQPIRKPISSITQPKVTKSDSALDLSTPHTIQSQLGPQQAKTLETMQSIVNLAKKQSYSQRMTSPSQVFSQESFKMNSSSNSSPTIRIPVPPQSKNVKTNNLTQVSSANSPKHFPDYLSKNSNNSSNTSPVPTTKTSTAQSTSYNQRTLTRSPSSSPKLVIACSSPKSQSPEEKQLLSPRVDSTSQSSLVSSSQISSTNHHASGESNETPKSGNKNQGSSKNASSRSNNNDTSSQASTSNSAALLMAQQQAFIRQQLELQTQLGLIPRGAAAQWFNNSVARAHFENIMKNINTQMPFSNSHNTKDNK